MANNSAPTHVFGGGVALVGNSFPSDNAANVTYGGFAPSFEILPGATASQTISLTDGLVFLIEPSVAVALNLPAVASVIGSRIYTFYVRAGGAGDTVTFTAGGVAISTSTVTTDQKANTVTVVYQAGAVASLIIVGA